MHAKKTMQNNIIVTRLFGLIKVNPAIEKKKLGDIYRNQYLPVTDRDIEKSLQYLLKESLIFPFRDRRGVSSWWEASVVEEVLATVTHTNNSSTRQLFEFYKQQDGSKLDIVGFQKLLMQLRDGGYISLIHNPAPSHWILNRQTKPAQELEEGELLQCA